MSPHVNAALLNFVGEALAIPIEGCVNERRVYDILAKMQHRQWYNVETTEWITTASKKIRKIYIPAKDEADAADTAEWTTIPHRDKYG